MFVFFFSMVSIYDSVCPAEATNDTAVLRIISSLLEKVIPNAPHQPVPRNPFSRRNHTTSLEHRFSPKGKSFSICLVEASLDTAILKKMSFSSVSSQPNMKIRSYLRYMIPALPLVPSEVISGAQYSSEGKKHSICLAGVSSGTAAPDKIFPTPTAKSVLLTTSKSIINQCRQKMQETTLSTTLQYRMVQRSVIGNPNIYNGRIHKHEVSVSLNNHACMANTVKRGNQSRNQIHRTLERMSSVSTRQISGFDINASP